MFTNITLPKQISQAAYQALVETIAGALAYEGDAIITDALNNANLQPTSRAVMLAAQAAVAVLLAHEIGQEVGQEVGQRVGYLDSLADNTAVFDLAEAAAAVADAGRLMCDCGHALADHGNFVGCLHEGCDCQHREPEPEAA